MKIISHRSFGPYDLKYMSDGILYVRVSKTPEETLEWLSGVVPVVGEMVNYQCVPMLSSHEEFSLPSKAVREFWAQKENCPYICADAFMVNNIAFKLLANFYIKTNKPERPTKLFTDHDEAITWLHKFI